MRYNPNTHANELPRCPGCGAGHLSATRGDGARVWCDGTEDKGNGALALPRAATVPDAWPAEPAQAPRWPKFGEDWR